MEKGPFYKEGALDRNGLFDPDQIAIYGLPALFDGEFDILAEFFLHQNVVEVSRRRTVHFKDTCLLT